MNRKLEFTKALRLLDAGRDEEAVVLLNSILEESRQENDPVNLVRSSCVLGEYYFNAGNLMEAKKNLEITTSAEVDEDQADIVDYELSQAREMLNNIG